MSVDAGASALTKEVTVAGLGATLRDVRLQRNVTLADAERDTKVRQVFLVALEQERFDLLPPRVFAQGLLWVYARYLHLDPRPLVEQLPPDPAEHQAEPSPRAGVDWAKASLFALLLLTLAIFIGVCNTQRLLEP